MIGRALCRLGFHQWHYAHCCHRWCKRCPVQQVWYRYVWANAPFWTKRYYYGHSGNFKVVS